ncbi:hypothetical protein DPMN_147019 [Dreissena polymorpha]|uniref:Uncharacterized protein n=1 Tax=Dreissena polymorpha TaxID=45954 RepID=A0A9D4J091_DREPO|nr:hypothetical protein DPMN_147019 [Dreissena polymorpha]
MVGCLAILSTWAPKFSQNAMLAIPLTRLVFEYVRIPVNGTYRHRFVKQVYN